MMSRSTPPTAKHPLWQRLLAPMLLASLGLHGVVLMIPLGASGEDPLPPPDPEQDSVAISRVPPAPPLDPTDSTVDRNPGVALSTQVAPQSPAPSGGGQPPAAPRASAPRGEARSGSANRPRPAQSTAAQRNPNSPPGDLPNLGHGANRPPAAATAASSAAPPPGTSSPSSGSAPASSTSSTQALLPEPRSSALAGSNVREQLQAHVARLNFPQARLNQLAEAMRERFRYNAAASSDEAFTTNHSRWQALIRQDTSIADLTADTLPDSVPLTYRQRACLDPAPGLMRVGLVAGPDGTHHREPVVLQSSGYGSVDAWALHTLTQQTLPAADRISAFILTVEPRVEAGPNPCLAVTPDS